MAGFILVTIYTQEDADIREHVVVGQRLAPGLAITPAVNNDTFTGGWTVTHLASGRCVLSIGPCLACLRIAARKLAESDIDWTRDMESLVADTAAVPVVKDFAFAADACDGETCGVLTDELRAA